MNKIATVCSLILAAVLLTVFLTGCGSGDHSGHDQKQHQH